MRTRAVKDGDEWVIDGTKNWITNLGIADFYVVFAVTDPRPAIRGASPRSWSRPTGPASASASSSTSSGSAARRPDSRSSTDVRVPDANIIGEVDEGFKVAMATLDRSRLGVAAQALGIAQGATDYAAAYARERRQFGKPINSFQAIQFKLADMETQCAAGRELLYQACAKIDRDDRGHRQVLGDGQAVLLGRRR